MNSKSSIFTRNSNGELIYHNLGDYLKKKYKADTYFDHPAVPVIIMIFCALVDAISFNSLMKLISYDDAFTRVGMMIGLLFGFDVITAYIAILHKRLRLGLTKDRAPLVVALIACATALAVNVILNIVTIDLLMPEVSSDATDFLNTAQQTVQMQPETRSIDPAAIASVIYRTLCPVITSFGTYFISYITYKPLEERARNIEEATCEKRDEIRRLDAVNDEYNAARNYEKELIEDIVKKYEAKKQDYNSKVISYCKYVEQKLKEHLADSSATSALSEDGCKAIIESLNTELEAFKKASGHQETCKEDISITDNITSYIAV